MSKLRSHKLKQMLRERRLVRFTRRFEESPVRGYVLAIGPKFFLLALVSDRIWFDGFEYFRINDISNLKPDPYAPFAEAALRKRRERRPKMPRVNVKDVAKLLFSASRAFPLVTIHCERVDPDVCWIGHMLRIENERVSLLEINPDGTWDKEPNEYRINEITRVNFGGDYEDALHLVGGDSGS